MLIGLADLDEGKPADALKRLQGAASALPDAPDTQFVVGLCQLHLKNWKSAQQYFEQALVVDEENFRAYDGLSEALLGQGRNEEAVESALECAPGHFHLGVGLARLGMIN